MDWLNCPFAPIAPIAPKCLHWPQSPQRLARRKVWVQGCPVPLWYRTTKAVIRATAIFIIRVKIGRWHKQT